MLALVLCLTLVPLAALVVLVVPWHRPARARLNHQGVQEIEVLVRGRFRPDRIVVKRGIPLRLHFRREEDTVCSEHIIFSPSRLAVRLPAHWTTPVSFTPDQCGDHLFTCHLGIYQGYLLVREPSPAELRQAYEAQQQLFLSKKGVNSSDDWYQPDHSTRSAH